MTFDDSDYQPIFVRVENILAKCLPDQNPSLPEIAKTLGMSQRSLVRRLKQEKTSFKEVKKNLRLKLIVVFFRSPRKYQMTEIAYRLGFSEVSAFTHACRKWTGRAPSELLEETRRAMKDEETPREQPHWFEKALGVEARP